jgi:hypothetical protein
MRHLRSRLGGAVCVAVVVSLPVGTAGAVARWQGTAPAATVARGPVLGSKSFAGPRGVGWGTYRPREIFNGGDPSGMITSITWTGWGNPTATGYGKGWIFKPGGGYYANAVTVELRADTLGHCTAAGPAAYRHLAVAEPSRPGGPLGKWFSWSGAKTLCHFGF